MENDDKIILPRSKEEVIKDNKKNLKLKKILYLIVVILVPLLFIGYDIYLVTKASAEGGIVYDNFKGVIVFLGAYFLLLLIHLDLYTREKKILLISILIVEFAALIYICNQRNANIGNPLSVLEMLLFSTPFITGVIQSASIKIKRKAESKKN